MGIAKPTNFAYPAYDLSPATVKILQHERYEFARIGKNRAYDPLTDHPLLIPSWAMKASNKEQIMTAFKEAHDGQIVVLTIHGVPDIEHPWVTTPPELFEEYLKYLSDNHYKVISFRDLKQYIDVKEALKKIDPDFSRALKK